MAATSTSWKDLRAGAALLPTELVQLLDRAALGDADFGSCAVPALDFAVGRAVDTVVSLLADGPLVRALPEPEPGPLTLGRSIRYLVELGALVSEHGDLGPPVSEIPSIDAPIDPSDAPAAFEVRRLVRRLQKDLGAMERWSEPSTAPRILPAIGQILEEAGARSSEPVACSELLRTLVELRNRWSHAGSGQAWVGEFGGTHLRPLLDLALAAAFELVVIDPLATILQRWVPATVKSITLRGEDRTHVLDLRYDQGGRLAGVTYSSDDAPPAAEGERWLIDTALDQLDGNDTALLVCPFGPALDILRSRAGTSGADIEIDASGSARLMAGVAAGRERDGRYELLCLPTSLAVTVSLHPDRNGAGALEASSSRWEEGIRCAKAAAQHVANTLEPGSVLVGEVTIEPSEAPIFDGLQGTTSASVAAARAVSAGIGTPAASPGLGNELQVEATAFATGSPQPWRDLFGWVDTESGALVGGQLPCPSMDVLLVVPIRSGHRRRAVQIRRLFQPDNPLRLPCPPQDGGMTVPGSDAEGTHLDRVAQLEALTANGAKQADGLGDDAQNDQLRQVVGALCTDLANALDGVEPNPNLALLRPLREQFDALGLLASPFTWTAGLLFAPDAPGLAPAQEWLKSLRLPDTVDVVKTTTHATT